MGNSRCRSCGTQESNLKMEVSKNGKASTGHSFLNTAPTVFEQESEIERGCQTSKWRTIEKERRFKDAIYSKVEQMSGIQSRESSRSRPDQSQLNES